MRFSTTTLTGEHSSGELRSESAAIKAKRIFAEELQRMGWNQADPAIRLKGNPGKMMITNRLRRETVLSVNWIVQRLSTETQKIARATDF
ncbi:MAG: hypothetical protein JWM99_3590 [Verrucomicrobiales bacterium]|nr:hypothetical protein [Verrucomicrobiales bacterium]